jgi:hypothetical protein
MVPNKEDDRSRRRRRCYQQKLEHGYVIINSREPESVRLARYENAKGVASCGNAASELGLSRCSETSGALKVPERVPIAECSMHAARYRDALDRVNGSKRCARGLLAPDRSFASAPFATIEGHLRNI